jgi:hypothetical protein
MILTEEIPRVIRKCRYFCIVEIRWKAKYGNAGKNDAREWARSAVSVLSKFSPPEQLRYASPDPLFKDGNLVGFTDQIHEKLVTLKRKYDAKNLFRNNVNISPNDE